MLPRTRALLLAIVATGCSSKLYIQAVGRPNPPKLVARAPDCTLTVYKSSDALDPSCVEVGDVYVGDTGWSTDCGMERVVDIVRKEACRYGADAAQIVSHHEPSFFGSTCHQVRARFVVCKPEDPDAV